MDMEFVKEMIIWATIAMMDIGWMIKNMEMEYISIPMEMSMREVGWMICEMAKAIIVIKLES